MGKAKEVTPYHHGNLRRVLLDAALALIAEEGRLDFTMRELARRAEVTHNAPYRHFASRDALVAALAEEGFRALRERSLRDSDTRGTDAKARVRALGASYVAFAVDQPHLFRLMFGEPIAAARASHPELAEAAEASFALLRDAIHACRKEGLLRKDVSTRDVTLVAWSLVHGLSSLLVANQIPGARGKVPSMVRQFASVFFDGALFHPTPATARTGPASERK